MSSPLTLKTLPYSDRFLSPPLKQVYSTRRPSQHLPVFSPRPLSSSAAAPMTAAAAIVEHVVLFKVRNKTDASKSDAMIGNLASLDALDAVSHLTAAPIHRRRSAAAEAAGFTHLLHSRHASKDDLAAYAADPAHVAVVKGFVLPICDDIMAVDWIGSIDLSSEASIPAGSAVRLTLAKPKEGTAAVELVAAMDEIRVRVPAGVRQVSFGENFSPARAKGYSVGFLTVFDGVNDLDALDSEGGEMEAMKAKIRPMLESLIVVDFVVPAKVVANL